VAPVAFLALVALGGFMVQQLWNWLLPTLFGWPRITVWQGFGLVALCRILFGGFGKGGGGGYPSGKMSRKERERFRHRMRERMGRSSERAPGPAPNETRVAPVTASDDLGHPTTSSHPEG
jgi:hypothetical protein